MDSGLGVSIDMEKALADGLREFATELRLIDVVEFVSYIRMDKFAHIENLIASAAEVHFKPGTLVFGGSADVHLDWGAAPTVWLDMEFRNEGIVVHFCIVLESCRAAVEINYMPGDFGSADDAGLLLRDAIADARCDERLAEHPAAPVVALPTRPKGKAAGSKRAAR